MTVDITNDQNKIIRNTDSPGLSADLWQGASPGSLLEGSRASGASAENAAARSALAPLTITENQSARAPATHTDSSAEPAAGAANKFLLQAAESVVNQSIYRLPSWSHLSRPAPNLGCVSSFSNRYREALQLSGLIGSSSDGSYRNYYQVNMDQLNKEMGHDNLLRRISSADLKEGDVIEGVTPDTSKRHMGIVGDIENGKRMVYDNVGGKWTKEPLQSRFGQYRENNYYRAYLPEKH